MEQPSRIFQVVGKTLKEKNYYSASLPQSTMFKSGIPQGTELEQVIYLLYTAVRPLTRNTQVGIVADDMATLAVHGSPNSSSPKSACNRPLDTKIMPSSQFCNDDGTLPQVTLAYTHP